MAKKNGDGTKRKGSDKARERYERNGKFTAKHIRMNENIRMTSSARATH